MIERTAERIRRSGSPLGRKSKVLSSSKFEADKKRRNATGLHDPSTRRPLVKAVTLMSVDFHIQLHAFENGAMSKSREGANT